MPSAKVKAKQKKDTTPPKLRPFVKLGFVEGGVSGSQTYGSCPLCGGANKLYINTETGQFSCKAGNCGREGNLLIFMREWYHLQAGDMGSPEMAARLEELAEERGLPVDILKEEGFIWDGSDWVYPVRNSKGAIVNLVTCTPGKYPAGLPEVEAMIFGLDELLDPKRKKERVYLCEGFWDRLAVKALLRAENKPGVAVGVPGADTFKDAWIGHFEGRYITSCYDYDRAGRRGTNKAHEKLEGVSRGFDMILWPDNLPAGFDMRDFYRAGGNSKTLVELTSPYENLLPEETEPVTPDPEQLISEWPPLSSGGRPTLEETFAKYEEAGILLTHELKQTLRCIYAVNISNQLPAGDPLWMQIAAPPSYAKTELLMSIHRVANCIEESQLSPKTLVSGFVLPGGKDPSLLPTLFGKTFILKDYTEILRMNKQSKDEIDSVLRGAYDGSVKRPFGNGIVRSYTGYFSMVCGVTYAIFGTSGAVLGERFLIFKQTGEGLEPEDEDAIIRASISNIGTEREMRAGIEQAAKDFLEWKLSPEDIPAIPQEYISRLVGLAQLTSMLRADVEKRDLKGEKLSYRPKPERGTRLAKQFAKLLQCLAIQNTPPRVTEADYAIVARVALNSCIGWNLDAVNELAKKDGQYLDELHKAADVPTSTLREQLEDMTILGIINKQYVPNPQNRGAPACRFWLSDILKRYWEMAGLELAAKPKPIRAGLKAKLKAVTPNGKNGKH